MLEFMYMKKLILALVVLALIGGAAFFMRSKNEPVAQQTSGERKTYEDPSISFKYPAELSVTKTDSDIAVTHSVPYTHPNPCDFIGGAEPLEVVTDIGFTMQVYELSLGDVVRLHESEFLQQEYFANDTFKLEPGFIDTVSYGSLKGYKVTSGAEGCGVYTYYFPVGNKTLFVQRPFNSDLNVSSDTSAETHLKLPGIIPPDKAETYFADILISTKVH
jgi:hypothetical protein